MKYAIFEDEQFSLQRLQMSVERLHPDYHLDFCGSSVAEAVEYFRSEPDVDLIFMDIELADGMCFEIFEKVNPCAPVIFTTAYDEYALKAFKTDSIDYLLKPVADTDLSLAINKFERRRGHGQAERQGAAESCYRPAPRRILAISGDRYIPVGIDEVAFFLSEDNCVYACLKSGRRRLTKFANLSEVSDVVSQDEFYRLSRNVTASIQSIKSVSKYFRGRLLVRLEAGEDALEVTVSADKRNEFLNWLGR